jgi:hypothetical protein
VFSLDVSAHRPMPTAMPEFRTVWTNPIHRENPLLIGSQCAPVLHRCNFGEGTTKNTTLTLYYKIVIEIFYI